MNIYIARHGETGENINGNYYGAMDVSLSDKGKKQSESIGRFIDNIDFNYVFTSEKKRTIETVKYALGANVEVNIDKRLNERNFGVFEGHGYEKLKELFPKEYTQWENNWIDYVPQEGESHRNVCERVFEFMDKVLKLEAENIFICAHAGVIRAMYCYLMEKNIEAFWKFGCKNGDLALLKYEYGNLYLDSIIPCGKLVE